jgi:hypothetical protein
MKIAADLCVYTNHEHVVEILESRIKDEVKWLFKYSQIKELIKKLKFYKQNRNVSNQ